ncbi:glycine cleavage system protein GcvH (plasmid) [Embleya sp. NBC_00888]|uniref:glycine cleavage system protein GcvH n=1 Tax=Embleya sp. NBC_00888 TaxID=2975960 RepID=UPI002F90A096|nr:glycine cleavage system protein GcvH [Embleya sp. NBC_00888]
MTTVPADRKYTQDHEWILPTTGGKARIGITDFAQKQLGDVVFVEVPTVGYTLQATEALGSVESVKAVTEIYAPVDGSVIAVNELLEGEPELLNTDPYDKGWVVEVTLVDPKSLNDLLTAERYQSYLDREESD